MLINWQSLLTTVGLGGVGLLAVAWLSKALVVHRLELDTEKFKTEIRAKTDIEIERLRSSLQMEALEHQIRFSKLHDKRAEVIAELYAKLADLYTAGHGFVNFFGLISPPEKREDAYHKIIKKYADFALFAECNQIYLPYGIVTLLQAFIGVVWKSVDGIRVNAGPSAEPAAKHTPEQTRAIMESIQAFSGQIPEIMQALSEEFRKILGAEG